MASCGHASSFAHFYGPVAGPAHVISVGGHGDHGNGYGHGHAGHGVDYVVRDIQFFPNSKFVIGLHSHNY